MKQANKNIPAYSIKQTLTKASCAWHATDYYISADRQLQTAPLLFSPNYYAFFICVNGWLKGSINELEITLKPFAFAAAGPSSVVRIDEISDDCRGRFIFFTRDFLLQHILDPVLLEAFYYLGEQIGFSLPLSESEARIFIKLYEILREKRDEIDTWYHREIIRSLFFTFLYEAAAIYKKTGPKNRTHTNRDHELHRQFTELLIVNNRVQHHLRFYAEHLFITPQHLIHAIKSASGKTPGALINEAIIAEARLMLTNPTVNIKQIARDLHFSDTAAFSKFFKKNTGITPSAYRAGVEGHIVANATVYE